jgi:transposase
MTTIQPEVIAGIDTHADTHHVAVIDSDGRRLGDAGFPATLIGYQAIAAFIGAFGLVQHVGIEGTHSYGAGVTMHLQSAGIRVVEVIRPNRQVRRMRGKSDPIDAYEAAKSVLASPLPRTGTMRGVRRASGVGRRDPPVERAELGSCA